MRACALHSKHLRAIKRCAGAAHTHRAARKWRRRRDEASKASSGTVWRSYLEIAKIMPAKEKVAYRSVASRPENESGMAEMAA